MKRTMRELLAVLQAQPNMEHAQAAVRSFEEGELDRVIDWGADNMHRVAGQYYGGLCDAERDRRRKLKAEIQEETAKREGDA